MVAMSDFLRFFTSVDNQKKMSALGVLSPVKGTEDSLPGNQLKEVSKLASAAKYFQLYYDQYMTPAVGQAVNDATQGIFAGTASPEDVAGQIESSAALELTP